MGDLVREYFERDFSLEDLDRLEALLEGPDENAERFAALAAAFYASLGLPKGPGRGRPWWKWGGWSLGLGLVGTILVWWRLHRAPTLIPTPAFRPVPEALPVSARPAVEAPLTRPASVTERRHRVRPGMHPAVKKLKLKPQAFPSSPSAGALPGPKVFDGLSIGIVVPEQGIVTVRILDKSGQVRRRLFVGVMDAGTHRMRWDGLDDRGLPAGDGDYRIEVWQGNYRRFVSVVLRRSVAHRNRRPAEP